MFNIVVLTGRLVADPEIKKTTTDVSVCTVNIAVEESTKAGKKTYFPQIVVWRQSAEYLCEYGKKGDFIEVHGRYTERMWEKDGQKRKSIEIVAENVFIPMNKGTRQPAEEANTSGNDFTELPDDDELPF